MNPPPDSSRPQGPDERPELPPDFDPVLAEIAGIKGQWNPQEYDSKAQEPAPKKASRPAAPVSSDQLPMPVLAAAALTAVDGFLAVILLALRMMSPETALSIVQTLGGLAVLFGIAPLGVAGVIYYQNRGREQPIPGTQWGNWATLAGVLLIGVTVSMQVAGALSEMVTIPGN